MRPINQRPSWLETILLRPIRVECWACLHFAWLDRSQQGVSPSDWTCPNCLTHQKRDKDGNIIPVPEMYDGSLNEEVADRVARSHKDRKRPSSRGTRKTLQDDFFCEMCNGHQRVVYQLLSNYIPDEEDENYDAYYENADTYRRQLEERYPLACTECLDKVQKELAQQNYRIKSSLLNATLNKSRGDKIRATRKYPAVGWLAAGSSWICAHGTLLSVEIADCFSLDVFPKMRIFELPKYLSQTAGSLTLHNAGGALSKFNLFALLPWSPSFGNLFSNLTEGEQAFIAVATLASLSIAGLYWDPLQFTIQKAPRIKIRARQYYGWARSSAVPLLILQYSTLFFKSWQLGLKWIYGILLLLHTLYLVAFLNGRYIQEFNELKLDNSSSYPSTLKAPLNSSISQEDKRKNLPDTFTAPTRSAAHFSDSHYTSTSRMLDNASRSRTSSPEINEINWSPKKTVPPASSRLPAAFGMYRDSNQSSRQDDSMLASTSQLGTTGSFLEQQASGQNGLTYKTDNKFRSRAYEPSPLANPSLVTNMGLSNMSLGEMFGFPSAKFQPPENHFAHRSANHQGAGASGAWSYRKATDTGGALGLSQSSTHRTHSRFSQNADVDMGDDDSQKLTSRLSTDTDADHTDTMFSSFGLGPTSSRSENNSNTNGRGAFAAQRYFPPEPETGLEDNFFGIVKIVDDYLPPQQGPRSIAGRNLMLKKRMARRWLGVLLLCRCSVLWKTMGGGSRLDLVGQAIFIGVILHATAFWLLDEYRLLRRYLDKESIDKKKSARDMDPFEPTTMDRICSYLLLLLLAARILNMTSWVFVDNVFGSLSATEDVCLPQDGILSECHRSATYSPNLMDWSPRVIQRVYPKVDGKEAARLLAFYAGWVHDIVMMALLAVLIAFGAGSALIKSYSSTTQEHKVKKRGS